MWKRCDIQKNANVYLKALTLLSRRDHSEQELFEKLKRVTLDEAAIHDVVVRLKAEGYLNEHRMAEILVRLGLAKGWGPLKIRASFIQKGLNVALLDTVLEWKTVDWLELAQGILGKKRARSTRKAQIDSHARFLLGRGFPRSMIRQVLIHEHQ